MTKFPTVIYILGAGRSGSTILSCFLNRYPEFTSLGEICHLRNPPNEVSCSCGENVLKCDFHSASFKDAYNYPDIAKLLERHRAVLIPAKVKESEYKIYSDVNRNLGKNNNFIIDSSKYPSRCLQLQKIKELKTFVLYVHRDPASVINSFRKNVQTRRSAFSAYYYYVIMNLLCIITYMRTPRNHKMTVRYEDFLADPEEVAAKIHSEVIKRESSMSYLPKNTTFKIPDHYVEGNRMIKENLFIRVRNKKIKYSRTEILLGFLAFPITIFLRLL